MEKIIKQIIFMAILTLGVYFTYQVYLGFLNLDIVSSPIYLWGKKFVAINFTIYIAAIAIVILLENKNPSKTMAWLMVLFLFPVVGFVFYILFGRSISYRFRAKRKRKRDINRLSRAADIQREIIDYVDLFQDNSKVNNKLLNLLLKNSNTPFTINNRVEVLTNGEATFDKIISELLLAQDHIHMEYFIIRDDEIGNRIKDILILKAKSGVKVRLVYDSVGSWRLGGRYIGALKEAGVEVNSFFPVVLPIISRELNYRNHRKIIVIDGCVGFVGGLNIGDEYLGKNPKIGFWRDTHLMLAGDSVYSLQQIFINDWLQASKENIDDDKYFPKQSVEGEVVAQVTSSGPDSNWQSILQAYFTMISTAEEKVWITTPYLVPDESLKMALITAALSGIDVRIIIPNKADHFFVYWASRDNVEDLLEAGVKIYTYNNGFVHSKILLVDSIAASVGTANLDMRSLEINFEVNAFLYDTDVLKRLEKDFIKDVVNSEEIIYSKFRERHIGYKLLESIGRLVSPLQ